MKIGAVILSRYNSSRLPGKALMSINGKTILDYIIERLAIAMEREAIVIATSDADTDDAIEEFANQRNVGCFRGSLSDVASRFYFAAHSQGWDYAIRINGDNVFVDTDVLKEMINVTKSGNYDFVSNVKGRTFPKGMSIEIVSLNYFWSVLPAITSSDEYREHVTLYLYEHGNGRSFHHVNKTVPAAAGIQLALDTPEDFDRTKEIISAFSEAHVNYNLSQIFSIWKNKGYETTI